MEAGRECVGEKLPLKGTQTFADHLHALKPILYNTLQEKGKLQKAE